MTIVQRWSKRNRRMYRVGLYRERRDGGRCWPCARYEHLCCSGHRREKVDGVRVTRDCQCECRL